MCNVAGLYADILSTLDVVLPNEIIISRQNGYPYEAWSKETRIRFADALTVCKGLEHQAFAVITDVLEHW